MSDIFRLRNGRSRAIITVCKAVCWNVQTAVFYEIFIVSRRITFFKRNNV